MFNKMLNCIKTPIKITTNNNTYRYLSSTEVATALRPFYFSVHPDLFGQHPNQRLVNENSLKQLSSFIQTIQSKKPIVACNLQFYLREVQNPAGKFQEVNIQLNEPNLRNTIQTILKTCKLSTKYLESVAPATKTQPQDKIFPNKFRSNKYTNEYYDDNTIIIEKKISKAQEPLTLRHWLSENHKAAKEKYDATAPMRQDIEKMCRNICDQFGVAEVRWECGWNKTHVRGCLLSFMALARDHPQVMEVFQDRILVFAHFTGLSLDGHIMLNSGEVRNNWLDLIKNVRKHDVTLLKLPAFEKALSRTLLDIKVVRRKFMPKINAEDYEKNLCKLMTTLGDYRGVNKYPINWPESLKDYELVVETEAGPLMVSPTGQFIVPSSIPGFLLVNFITDNLKEAEQKAADYKGHKHLEKSLHAQCIKEFNLKDLRKDDNVTPDMMIKCCEKLLENKDELYFLKGLNLSIGTYYSVLSDGIVCIPCNWIL